MFIFGVSIFSYLRTSVIINSSLKRKFFHTFGISPLGYSKCSLLSYSTEAARKQKYPSYFYKKQIKNKRLLYISIFLGGYILLGGGVLIFFNYKRAQKQKENKILEQKKVSKFIRAYTAEEVAKHPTWTIYNGSVYDFEKYEHPSGQELLYKAGGGSLEPYWEKYDFHKDPKIMKQLKSLKIGELITEEEVERCKAGSIVSKPNLANYRLLLVFKDIQKIDRLTIEDIMSFPKFSLTTSIPCQNDPEKIETGGRTWSGTRLIDIIEKYDINLDLYRDVIFECLDRNRLDISYGTRIPTEKVKNPNFDILLAYELNGKDIPLEQGYPVRLVVPELPGGQNVKWIEKIIFDGKKRSNSQ